jgi:hypothetical protein
LEEKGQEAFDEEGRSVFLAPLARHVRLDEEGIIWIRPIVGGYRPEARGKPGDAFDLSVARRRPLAALEIRREGDGLILQLLSGDEAHIRWVRQRIEPELEKWDRFFLQHLGCGRAARDGLADGRPVGDSE